MNYWETNAGFGAMERLSHHIDELVEAIKEGNVKDKSQIELEQKVKILEGKVEKLQEVIERYGIQKEDAR